jgi:hypothetical protein
MYDDSIFPAPRSGRGITRDTCLCHSLGAHTRRQTLQTALQVLQDTSHLAAITSSSMATLPFMLPFACLILSVWVQPSSSSVTAPSRSNSQSLDESSPPAPSARPATPEGTGADEGADSMSTSKFEGYLWASFFLHARSRSALRSERVGVRLSCHEWIQNSNILSSGRSGAARRVSAVGQGGR